MPIPEYDPTTPLGDPSPRLRTTALAYTRLHYAGNYSLRRHCCVCPLSRGITREIQCVFWWILRGRLWLVSRHLPISSPLMKPGREANILRSSLLSSIPLCTLLLIVNLRSYDTKVRLTRPRCRVIEFVCAIFKDSNPPLPSVGEVVTCMWMCAGLRGGAWLATVLFCQSSRSWSRESARWNIQPVTVRRALMRSGAVFLFSFCFINLLSQENPQSTDALLQWSPASHSYRQNTSSMSVRWAAPLEHCTIVQ